jgi:hypothetical protein
MNINTKLQQIQTSVLKFPGVYYNSQYTHTITNYELIHQFHEVFMQTGNEAVCVCTQQPMN